MSTTDLPKSLRPFAFHGVHFDPSLTSADDWLSSCPFCGKGDAFAVNVLTTKWTCHSSEDTCGRKGNATTFLTQYWRECYESTSDKRYEAAAADRGLPAEVLRDIGKIAWDSNNRRYLIPCFLPSGEVGNLLSWKIGQKPIGTAGVSSQLWGMDNLANASKFAQVFITEGPFDGIAATYTLAGNYKGDHVVVSLPGARVFKDEWAEAIGERGIVVIGDNDIDGDRMAEKIWSAKVKDSPVIEFVNWPDGLPDKFDVRDFVTMRLKNGQTTKTVWKDLKALVSDRHRRMPFNGQEDIEAARTGVRVKTPVESNDTGPTPTFKEVIDVYKNWLKITDDLEMAIETCYSTYVSATWGGGTPLWMFLVGAPGSCKSEILVSMSDAPLSVFASSVNRETLLSGFAGPKDPSLIPKLIGKCGIFKDWTEMLDAHPLDQAKAYACLRGFYDGRVDRTFGNGQTRNYIGTCGMLAGVTNDIYKFSKASLGERFLKFQLPRPGKEDRESIIEAAMLGVTDELAKDTALKSIARRFLTKEREPRSVVEACPPEFRKRVGALAELIGILRQSVEWAGPFGSDGKREIAFQPEPEMATRLAKQFTKLAIANCAVRDKDTADDRTWRIIERVGFNTAHGFNLDVVQAVMECGGEDVDVEDIEAQSRMHRGTLDRRLETLSVLNIVTKRKVSPVGRPGGAKGKWSVAPNIRGLYSKIGVVGDHAVEALAFRRTKQGFKS